jgi:hypothetical protein
MGPGVDSSTGGKTSAADRGERMNRRNCYWAVIGCLALGIGAPRAAAQVLVNDTFDTYADQNAFQAVWVPIGTVAPTSAVLSTEQAVSGTQSIKVEATATTGQERNRLTFAETGGVTTTNRIVFSFDFFDSNSAAAPYRQFSNLQDTTAPSGTNQLVALGLNNNQSSTNSGGNFYMARILGYDPSVADPDGGPTEQGTLGAGAFFKLNDFGVGLRSTGWHTLKVLISTDDGASTDYEFYVDNVLAERVSNVGTAASIRSYDNIALGSGLSNASNAAYFDNMHLEIQPVAVPEPSTLALAGVGLGGLVVRRLRRKA